MSVIELNLPAAATVVGELLSNYEADERDEDVVQISLPTGFVIDVGWSESQQEGGSFRISVFYEDWLNQDRAPIFADDPYDVASYVEELAREYCDDGEAGELSSDADEEQFDVAAVEGEDNICDSVVVEVS